MTRIGQTLGLLVLLTAPALGQMEQPLLPRHFLRLPHGELPTAFAVADLDRDGDLDVITIEQAYGTLHTFMNNGFGLFAMHQSAIVATNPVALVAADLNGDGAPDVAVCDADSDQLLLMLNDGSGTLLSFQAFPLNAAPSAIATADVDGDSDFDLLVASVTGGMVTVMANTGGGSFSAGQVLVAGITPTDVVARDLNGDQRTDVAVADYDSDSVLVLLQEADGSFSGPQAYATHHQPVALCVGDIDGDRAPDLLAANANVPHNTLSVLMNDGNGAFPARTDWDAGRALDDVTVGDIDGNGTLDVVTTSVDQLECTLLLNHGGGGLALERVYWEDTRPKSAVVADIDVDGWNDLLLLGVCNDDNLWIASGVVCYMNRGGTLFATTGLSSHGWPTEVVVADFNGDGFADAASANPFSHRTSVFLNDTAGGLYEHLVISTPRSGSALDAADLDGNHTVDLVTTRILEHYGDVSVLFNQGEATFTDPEYFGEGLNRKTVQWVRAADFDGDGAADVIVTTPIGASVATNDGAGRFGPFRRVSIFAGNRQLRVGDLNGDGHMDFVTRGYESVEVCLNDGTANFTCASNGIDFAGSSIGYSFSLTDIDDDGDLDVLIPGYPDTQLYLNRGDGMFDLAVAVIGGDAGTIVDVNDDGNPDILVSNFGYGFATLMLNIGELTFVNQAEYACGGNPADMVPIDVDNDGHQEILVVNEFFDSITFIPSIATRKADCNCSTTPDLEDITAFVIALSSAGEYPQFASYYMAYPHCTPWNADANFDGRVDLFDIDSFVTLISGD